MEKNFAQPLCHVHLSSLGLNICVLTKGLVILLYLPEIRQDFFADNEKINGEGAR
jgi:hypothetical protein